ncbi:MAG: DNA-methyltransferase, partial [Acidimicrobiales bacterium]
PSESATRVGHPAPFPVELPRRLIELYTYRGDLVLDPFMGSGSTALAAIRTERHYVGFDTDEAYVALAERRIAEERAVHDGAAPGRSAGHRVTVSPGRPAPDPAGETFERDVARGQKAAELARRALEDCGFEHIERNVAYRDLGIGVDFRARDARGGLWLFDLSGGFSVTRPGLRRPDVLLKTLGKASVLYEARKQGERADIAPLIVLSTDVPAGGSPGAKSLRAVQGGPVHDVVELLDPGCMARLAAYGKDGRPPG